MATTTLTGRTTIQLANTYTKDGDLGDAVQSVPINSSTAWTDGTGTNQAQQIFEDENTLANGGAIDYDLTALASPQGTITLTSIKELYLEVTTATSGYSLEVGGDANSVPIFKAVNDVAIVTAGGKYYAQWPINGIAVTNATGDILQISNPSAGNVTYKLILKGLGTLA